MLITQPEASTPSVCHHHLMDGPDVTALPSFDPASFTSLRNIKASDTQHPNILRKYLSLDVYPAMSENFVSVGFHIGYQNIILYVSARRNSKVCCSLRCVPAS